MVMRIPEYQEIYDQIRPLSDFQRGGTSIGSLSKRACVQGDLHRIIRGIYIHKHIWQAWSEDNRVYANHIAYAFTHRDFYFSHTSAAIFHGLDLLKTPETIHIIAKGQSRPGRKSAVCHRTTSEILSQCYLTENLVPVTSALQTVLDCAKTLHFQDAVILADSAMRSTFETSSVVNPQELQEELSEYPGYRKKQVHAVARAMSQFSGSAAETITRLALTDLGFPVPKEQYRIQLDQHHYYDLDFAFPEYKLFVEVDGQGKYFNQRISTSKVIQAEHKRQRTVEKLTGWRCVRIYWDDIYPSPVKLYRALEPYLPNLRSPNLR